MPAIAPPLPPDPPALVAPVSIDQNCLINASAYYRIPPEVLIAIRIQEGGTTGRHSVNRNGSLDLGPMQVNTSNLYKFRPYGVGADQIQNDECVNIFAGAYILFENMQRHPGDIWSAIGDYNSAVPKYHNDYRRQVSGILARLYASYRPYITWLRYWANLRLQDQGSAGSLTRSTPAGSSQANGAVTLVRNSVDAGG